jgi:hypothetical protein
MTSKNRESNAPSIQDLLSTELPGWDEGAGVGANGWLERGEPIPSQKEIEEIVAKKRKHLLDQAAAPLVKS